MCGALAVLVACTPDSGRTESATPPVAASPPPSPLGLENTGIFAEAVGPFQLDMAEDQAVSLFPAKRVRSAQRQAHEPLAWVRRYDVVDSSDHPLLRLAVDSSGRLAGIVVLSALYNTPEGLGVGSTLDELRNEYPDLELSSLIGDEAWVSTPDKRLQFSLDTRPIGGVIPGDEDGAPALPGSLVVMRVVVQKPRAGR